MKPFKVLETIYTHTNLDKNHNINSKECGTFDTKEQAISYALELENEWFIKHKNNLLDKSICAIDITIETWDNKKLVEIKKTLVSWFLTINKR